MRVLLLGETPESVDFNDPSLPKGLTAQKIRAGIDRAMQDMSSRGWEATLCLVQPDDSAARAIEDVLTVQPYDVVVIGGGIRVPPKSLRLFERLINVIHKAAPDAAIAFNTSPEDTADAAARWTVAE